MLNLEIKEYYTPGNESRCVECIEKCVEMIEKFGFRDKMVFNSFDAYVLEYLAEHYPDRYLLHGFYPYSIMTNVKRNPDEYLYCACVFSMNPANYRYLQSHNIEPWIGAGVTIQSRLKECLDMGARLVTTNFPEDCIKKLERIGAR
jgi:glycerophosphoryl diester phosphodiesterase